MYVHVEPLDVADRGTPPRIPFAVEQVATPQYQQPSEMNHFQRFSRRVVFHTPLYLPAGDLCKESALVP